MPPIGIPPVAPFECGECGESGSDGHPDAGLSGFPLIGSKRRSKKLCMTRIQTMKHVSLMPLTTVLAFEKDHVRIRTRGRQAELPAFSTVILCTGMLPQGDTAQGLGGEKCRLEVLGDAREPGDIYSAVRAGYELATKY